MLSLGDQPAHRLKQVGYQPTPKHHHRMLGLFKLISPTRFVRDSILAIALLSCLIGLGPSITLAQQAVYPYPAAQRPQTNAGNSRGLLTGFSQQTAFQFQGQTPNVVDPNLAAPSVVAPNAFQGFDSQSVLTQPGLQQPGLQQPGLQQPGLQQPGFAQPGLAQPQAFPGQLNFGTQQGFGVQPGLGVQQGFNPQIGLPQGAQQADLDVFIPAGPTGKLVAGGTFGSDNGLIGEIIVDERDFNIFAFPRSLRELVTDPRVFRGAGQSFRAEIVPGSDLERYLISWGDPLFLNSNLSVNLSGYYFDRQFLDWDEQRAGGKLRLGRSLTNFLSVRGGLQLENVNIDNPRLTTSDQLNADLGNSNLFTFDVGLVYDTRQSPYLLDSGSYLGLTFRQAFGDFDFSRFEVDYRIQRLIYKRTATTGHHTLSFRTKLGFSGSSTPIFENFFAGGVSSLRGFSFRGVSPVEGGVRVGGEFQWLNSLEYQFPITNDDAISGVAFVDFGTVEEDVDLNSDNFRVAPGVGLRAHVPFLGISAPLSLDFAFATDEATGDDRSTISFLIGIVR